MSRHITLMPRDYYWYNNGSPDKLKVRRIKPPVWQFEGLPDAQYGVALIGMGGYRKPADVSPAFIHFTLSQQPWNFAGTPRD
jgi:hypothetical protein